MDAQRDAVHQGVDSAAHMITVACCCAATVDSDVPDTVAANMG
jgi:hypothetical protein